MTNTIRKTLAATTAALLAIVLAACGGSEDPATEPTNAPTAAGTVVEVSGVEYAYELSTTTVPAGTVTFNLTNNGTMSHDAVLEDAEGQELGNAVAVGPGDTSSFTIELEPGTYTLYCSVGNHRAQGMEIDITVE